MQVVCDKCQGAYHASGSFGQERLWRLVCPHCGGSMWVSPPSSDRTPRTAEPAPLLRAVPSLS